MTRARRRPAVTALVESGRLQEIAADQDEARDLLDQAETHLRSAERLLDDDPAAAYQLAYDAARKATSADMLANGLRTRSDRPGAHAATVLYAEATFVDIADADSLASFDQMRRQRNRTEYGAAIVGREQRLADLGHARELVRAVRSRFAAAQ